MWVWVVSQVSVETLQLEWMVVCDSMATGDKWVDVQVATYFDRMEFEPTDEEIMDYRDTFRIDSARVITK